MEEYHAKLLIEYWSLSTNTLYFRAQKACTHSEIELKCMVWGKSRRIYKFR